MGIKDEQATLSTTPSRGLSPSGAESCAGTLMGLAVQTVAMGGEEKGGQRLTHKHVLAKHYKEDVTFS